MKCYAWCVCLIWCSGCTSEQLLQSTSNTAGTVMDIQYQIVLDNGCRLARDPAALPSQIRIKQGTIQVSDEWGLYQLQIPISSETAIAGPRAERTVSEQWGADAISDPRALKQLQDLYRAALGLPPLPDPVYLATQQDQLASSPRPQKAKTQRSHATTAAATTQPQGKLKIDLDRDVPRGWLHYGARRDVPRNRVRYLSHCGDTWAWVMPQDMPNLSQFTLLVLYVTKLGPGENNNSGGGLMYTAGDR